MAVFPTTTWLNKAKLHPPVGKDWEIQFRLLANGKMPISASTSNRSTELWMMISRDVFWVDIQHGGKRDSISIARGEKWARHYNQLRLPDPSLTSFAPWLASAEERFGKAFHRDKVWVQSNVKGGRDAVVAWIQNGFSF